MAFSLDDAAAEIARLQKERDLYRKLLDLGATEEIESFLQEALALVVDLVGARCGYLELQDDRSEPGRPLWWIARGCSDEEVSAMRAGISRGIIAEALATGRTIVTASAVEDPRFRERGSVREHRIQAVLCAPIGADPPLGILCLQGRDAPGPFSTDDRLRAETFARHLAPFTDRLLLRRRRRDEGDPTRPLRDQLKLDGVIGRSAALARVLQQIALVAPREVGVLLTGDSGTGKTQLARVIHENGPRARGPFVELNCAALPEALVESELFGAMPGAHSTAARKVEGKVAAAEGGTLFLDEVGELHLSAQAKLLQLLQSKEYYPLGASRPLKADVRILAATNADLKLAVEQRRFRQDLLYRLQVVPIRVPPLAERRDDIPALVAYFCARAADGNDLAGAKPSPGAVRAAEAAEWPGNIRQLAHAVEAAVIRAAGDGALQIERRHLFPEEVDGDGELKQAVTFQGATRQFQSSLVQKALEETAWNIVETASRLDLTRSHVYNLIRAHGLERRRA